MTSSNNDLFVKRVQKWVELDNEIKIHTEEINKIKEGKNKLSMEMMDYMKHNDIPGINITGGKIKIIEKNVPISISYKFLEDCLNAYFTRQGLSNANEYTANIVEFTKNERKKADKKSITLERFTTNNK